MDSRPWRERLVQQLRQQHLPPSYIERLVAELADHATDLQQENVSMDAQQSLQLLGSAADLAAVAGREFRQRTFAGRHPWLTFIAGPVAVAPVVFIALVAGLISVGWVLGSLGDWLYGEEIARPPLSQAEARFRVVVHGGF